jgi:hypothetical protein
LLQLCNFVLKRGLSRFVSLPGASFLQPASSAHGGALFGSLHPHFGLLAPIASFRAPLGKPLSVEIKPLLAAQDFREQPHKEQPISFVFQWHCHRLIEFNVQLQAADEENRLVCCHLVGYFGGGQDGAVLATATFERVLPGGDETKDVIEGEVAVVEPVVKVRFLGRRWDRCDASRGSFADGCRPYATLYRTLRPPPRDKAADHSG